MVEQARANFQQTSPVAPLEFLVADVMATRFPDRSFDAVISSRLFHHFSESDTRRRALAELHRISKGPVIVSFFNSFALSSLWRRVKYAIRAAKPNDRIAIPASVFESDANAAGLKLLRLEFSRRGISPQTYAVLSAT
jgi:hypothetical protein